jgi:8-oxo-dGTP pyrophosphatase MutT (NUDIX family)
MHTIPELESYLRTRLTRTLPGPVAQLPFAPEPRRKGWEPHLTPEGARQAAALILIYPGPGGLSIPLTIRRDDLPHHPGQISLPGGAIDPGEEPPDAALREAYEEIGVRREAIRLVGALSSLWVVVSGFVVHPFVGVTDERPDFQPHVHEVAGIIEAPVQDLLNPSARGRLRRNMSGALIDYQHFEVAGHQVWGATGMMLGEFVALFD